MATTNRYLVTGARGQDGLILISKLAAQGHEVLGVVRKQADADFVKLYEPKVKVICLNLLDKDTVDLNDANRLIISKNKDEFLIHKYKLDENSCKVYPARIGSQNWRYIWCSLY